MKKIIVAVLVLMLTISTALAESFRVYDNAGLFTPEEENMLEAAILDYRWHTKTDFCVFTTDDYLGTDYSTIWAENFYEIIEVGVGEEKDGMLMYFDVYNSNVTLCTKGLTGKIFPLESWSTIFDAVRPAFQEGNYFAMVKKALEVSQEHHDAYWSALLEP